MELNVLFGNHAMLPLVVHGLVGPSSVELAAERAGYVPWGKGKFLRIATLR